MCRILVLASGGSAFLSPHTWDLNLASPTFFSPHSPAMRVLSDTDRLAARRSIARIDG